MIVKPGIQSLNRRKFCSARRTPGSPEVDEDDLALQGRKLPYISSFIFKGKIQHIPLKTCSPVFIVLDTRIEQPRMHQLTHSPRFEIRTNKQHYDKKSHHDRKTVLSKHSPPWASNFTFFHRILLIFHVLYLVLIQ